MSPTVALAAHRLKPAPNASREERLRRSREMLAHALTQGTTVAVVGSGCSAPLGYPSWRGFAAEIVNRTLSERGDPAGEGGSCRDRLLRFKARLEAPRVESPELMFMIGACKRLFDGYPPGESPYYRYLTELFRPRGQPVDHEHNPHRALLGLPIHRFVTTNYDCEIEEAARPRESLSFTQKPENYDHLALFALSRVGAVETLVFHCHGRYDDPQSIIATEGDYQRWYLAQEGTATPAFLQTFDLLFTSNPILFVGFGLADEDLLRPLRRIAAASPERRELRPLFALVPEIPGADDRDLYERLFERYGLNVISFPSPATDDPKARGQALSAALAHLEMERHQWRDDWLRKPMMRKVTVHARPPQPYRHYSFDPGGHEILGPRRVAEKLEELKAQALAGVRVIGLVGPGGTGKSFHAMRLLEVMERETHAFEGFFFWSSYYADDSITGLDRLLGYIDPRGNRPAVRLIRLRERLATSRFLLVLDGFERLLSPTDDPEVGRSNDPVTLRLLEILAHPDSKSTLILTSRLWPGELDATTPGIEKHALARMRTDDVQDIEPYTRLNRAQVSALCSLLDGHTYALFLAARLLERHSPGELQASFRELHRELSSASPSRRLARMIELSIAAVDGETHGLAGRLLERLAVFMSPVSQETLVICFALADRAYSPEIGMEALLPVMNRLHYAGLLFKIVAGSIEREAPAYTVHPTVRSYVFHRERQVERDELPNFTLAGLTSGRAVVYPGTPDKTELIRELFDRLQGAAVKAVREGRSQEARGFCRSLFGVMRSRMESNTVPRWTTYPDYIRFGLRLADLVKQLSPDRWSFREPHELQEIEDDSAPLYADELAYVYNDIGLTLGTEGYMRDALAVWEQGYDINRIIEGTAEVPLYSLQSQLHLAYAFLELGQLLTSAQYLEEAARTNHKIQDPDYHGRILGYRALIDYYRGFLKEADSGFEDALKKLKEAGGNPRAQSFFLIHRAKLAMSASDFTLAAEYVGTSRALAASGQFEDLLLHARATQGRLNRERGSFPEANAEYHAALAEARRLGIRRLEAEILTGLAQLALRLEDAALARSRATAALGIANELGLGLRQTRSLLILGVATIKSGQPRLGRAYLRLAKGQADEQEYWLSSREAEQYLQVLGEEENR